MAGEGWKVMLLRGLSEMAVNEKDLLGFPAP
jgi:hypothetical protein